MPPQPMLVLQQRQYVFALSVEASDRPVVCPVFCQSHAKNMSFASQEY